MYCEVSITYQFRSEDLIIDHIVILYLLQFPPLMNQKLPRQLSCQIVCEHSYWHRIDCIITLFVSFPNNKKSQYWLTPWWMWDTSCQSYTSKLWTTSHNLIHHLLSITAVSVLTMLLSPTSFPLVKDIPPTVWSGSVSLSLFLYIIIWILDSTHVYFYWIKW